MNPGPPCFDCGAKVGELHLAKCDVERCPDTGCQRLCCDCIEHTYPRIPWSGMWPGDAECIELGWYAVFTRSRGWVRCDKDTPGAHPDLGRLSESSARWDPVQVRWVFDPETPPET